MARGFAKASTEYLESNSFTAISGVPLTISCWFYFTDQANADDEIAVFVGDSSDPQKYYIVDHDNAGARIRARHLNGAEIGTSQNDSGINYDTWQNFVGVFASTTSRTIYVDGSAATEDTTSVTDITTADTISIARRGDSTPAQYADGRAAEVAVWSAALTQGQVSMLASGFSPLFVQPESLVFYAPLIRDEDFDIVGGLNLTAGGTPTIENHPSTLRPAPIIFVPFGPSSTIEQEGYRWRDDDGDEANATWLVNQDTTTSVGKNVNIRLRVLLNATGDPASIQPQLEVKESSDPATEWKKINA